jgi:hypothetical protein
MGFFSGCEIETFPSGRPLTLDINDQHDAEDERGSGTPIERTSLPREREKWREQVQQRRKIRHV